MRGLSLTSARGFIMSNTSHSYPVPMPPPAFFKNDIWRRKLVKLGATYAQSAELASEIAKESYLMPVDLKARYLRSCVFEWVPEEDT